MRHSAPTHTHTHTRECDDTNDTAKLEPCSQVPLPSNPRVRKRLKGCALMLCQMIFVKQNN